MTGSAASARPRTQRSCLTCTRRKVGCDRVRPTCGRCQRSGLPCSYGPVNTGPMPLRFIDETPNLVSERARSSGQRSTASRGAASSVPRRLEHLDQMLHAMNESPPPEQTPQSMRDIGHLYSGRDGDTMYVSGAYWAMISQGVGPPSHTARADQSHDSQIADIDQLLRRQQSPRSSSPQGGTSVDDFASLGSFVSSSSSAFPSSLPGSLMPQSEQQLLSRALYGDIFHHFPSPSPSAPVHSNLDLRNATRTEFLAAFPTIQQSNVLVWAYMRGHHAIAPLMHGPTFLSKFLSFQAWREHGADPCPFSNHFIAFVAAALFAGLAVCPAANVRQIFGDTPREALLVHLYDLAVQAIRRSNFPNAPSVESLAAFVITDTIWLREEQPLACCAFIGLAVRVAQMLGLHKGAGHFPTMSFIDMEVRRRIWWYIVACDVNVAIASGLVSLIHPSSCDVHGVSEQPEGRLAETGPQSGPMPQKSILGVLSGGRVYWVKRVNVLVRILNTARLTRDDVDKALKLTAEVQRDMEERIQRVDEIEASMSATGESGSSTFGSLVQSSETNPRLARWARCVLSLFAMKLHPIIYGPARRSGQLEYYMRREPRAMAYNKRFLHSFLLLCQTPDFQQFHWTWPGQHQPLHALVAIMQDLDDNPMAAGTAETRRLVDLAIRMSSLGLDYAYGAQASAAAAEGYPSGGETPWSEGAEGAESWGINAADNEGNVFMRPLTQGGNEAWAFIRRMRGRVWRRAGLDPSLLSCPLRADEIDLEKAEGASAVGPQSSHYRSRQSMSSGRSGRSSSSGSNAAISDESDDAADVGQSSQMGAIDPRYASSTVSSSASTGMAGTAFSAGGGGASFFYGPQPIQQPPSPMQTSPLPQRFEPFNTQAGATTAVRQAGSANPSNLADTLFQAQLPQTDEDWARFANSLDPQFFDEFSAGGQQQQRHQPGRGPNVGQP